MFHNIVFYWLSKKKNSKISRIIISSIDMTSVRVIKNVTIIYAQCTRIGTYNEVIADVRGGREKSIYVMYNVTYNEYIILYYSRCELDNFIVNKRF